MGGGAGGLEWRLAGEASSYKRRTSNKIAMSQGLNIARNWSIIVACGVRGSQAWRFETRWSFARG